RLAEPPTAWRAGTTRLLDYGASAPDGAGPARGSGLPLLVVPSLINRGYVLDLSARARLMRWLAARGFRPFLVDWGAPGAAERQFDLTAYVVARLEPALEAVLATSGRQPALIGYCMGGLLALALAQRRAPDIAGLACLATPWDFHAERADRA